MQDIEELKRVKEKLLEKSAEVKFWEQRAEQLLDEVKKLTRLQGEWVEREAGYKETISSLKGKIEGLTWRKGDIAMHTPHDIGNTKVHGILASGLLFRALFLVMYYILWQEKHIDAKVALMLMWL